tara:strand:+ start:412 stop:612 length:201 start_codon:yes stop_codon:yes gene_type:complete
MSKVNIEMDVFTAAAVRQILFREQEIYTHDPTCVPPRITSVREIIQTIDDGIESVLGSVEQNVESE